MLERVVPWGLGAVTTWQLLTEHLKGTLGEKIVWWMTTLPCMSVQSKCWTQRSGLCPTSWSPQSYSTSSHCKQEPVTLKHSSSVLTSNKLTYDRLGCRIYCLACSSAASSRLETSVLANNQTHGQTMTWAEYIHSVMLWSVRNNVTTCRLGSVYFLCWIYHRIT